MQKKIFILFLAVTVATTSIPMEETQYKNELTSNLVKFKAENPENIFLHVDLYTNDKNKVTVQELKGLTATLLPHVLTNDIQECGRTSDIHAQAFFTYLDQHPNLLKHHTAFVTSLKNYVLNKLMHEKTVFETIDYALFFAADEWLSGNIQKLLMLKNQEIIQSVGEIQNLEDIPYTFLKSSTITIKPILEKLGLNTLDTCFKILAQNRGFVVQNESEINIIGWGGTNN